MKGIPMDDYAKSLNTSAIKTGNDAVQNFNPTATSSNQLSAYNNLNANQNAQSNDFVGKFANTIAGQPTLTSAYDTANAKYNVPGLAQTANTLTNQLNNVLPTAYSNARGFDVSDSQAQQQAMVNSRFLAPQATQAQNNLGTAQGLASGYVNQQQAQNQYQLQPLTAEQAFIQQQQNNQATNQTTNDTNTFNALSEKLKQGIALSSAEMQTYQQLVSAQASMQNAQTAANAEIEKQKLANQYQIVPQNNNLVNTFAKTLTNPSLANPYGLRSLQ